VIAFLLRRLLALPAVLFCIATLSFFLMRFTPGGPYDKEKVLDPELETLRREALGLNEPLHRQYLRYLGNLVRGDLGYSYKYKGERVSDILAQSFPVSLSLGLSAMGVALVLGLSCGILAAVFRNRWQDHAVMSFAMIGISLPSFVLAFLLVVIFSIKGGWLPIGGWWLPWEERGGFRHVVLPIVSLATLYVAYIARLARGSVLETLGKDFIRTARAKGLDPRRVVLVHALKEAMLPIVSYIGPATAAIVVGSLVVEKIFNIPGTGEFFVNGALARDYTLVMGMVLTYSGFLLFLNLLVDLAYAWLDPRIRYD
jgi:oligopeptide transport system permease protein